MTFPAVEATANGDSVNSETSHTIPLPSGVTAGDLLLAFIAADGGGSFSNWTDGFTELADWAQDDVAVAVAYKQASGSETSVDVDYSVSERAAYLSFRISGAADPSTQAPEVSTGATASSGDSPDPDSLTPTGGAKDYLWIAMAGWRLDGTATAYPSNYSDNQMYRGIASGGTVALATRELNAASENPGSFTKSESSREWVAATIAVHPPGGTEYDDSVTVAREHGVAPGGIGAFTRAATLAREHTLAGSGSSALFGSLSMAREHALSPAGSLGAADALVLSREQAISATAILDAGATVALARALGQAQQGGLVITDSLSLGRAGTLARASVLVADEAVILRILPALDDSGSIITGTIVAEGSATLQRQGALNNTAALEIGDALSLARELAVAGDGALSVTQSITLVRDLALFATANIDGAATLPPLSKTTGFTATGTLVIAGNLVALGREQSAAFDSIISKEVALALGKALGLDADTVMGAVGAATLSRSTSVEAESVLVAPVALALSREQAVATTTLAELVGALVLARDGSLSTETALVAAGEVALALVLSLSADSLVSKEVALTLARSLATTPSSTLEAVGAALLGLDLGLAGAGALDGIAALSLDRSLATSPAGALVVEAAVAAGKTVAVAVAGAAELEAALALARDLGMAIVPAVNEIARGDPESVAYVVFRDKRAYVVFDDRRASVEARKRRAIA